MIIKKINEKEYETFVSKHSISSFYQSVEWMHLKEKEGKKCELIGIYDKDLLVGVSLIIYIRVLKKYYIAYASRGIIYDYSDVRSLKDALLDYYKDNKEVIMVKLDPPIICAEYDKNLEKEEHSKSLTISKDLKDNGFINTDETYQFHFVHRITLLQDFEEQKQYMSKSTKKNMELTNFKGVKIEQTDDLDIVYEQFQNTVEYKSIKSFNKDFYKNIIDEFKDLCRMYIVYIDKETYVTNLNNKLAELQKELLNLQKQMEKINVGVKIKTKESQLINSIEKYKKEIKESEKLADRTNIASMLTITKYDEVASLSSGMDSKYRDFVPKYIMYPKMIEDAFKDKLKYVNFLGVRNIFDKNDPAHGVYEVKVGFGGKTLEYIGEFDLVINKTVYYLYKFINKIKK